MKQTYSMNFISANKSPLVLHTFNTENLYAKPSPQVFAAQE